jgi:hypothetical protein
MSAGQRPATSAERPERIERMNETSVNATVSGGAVGVAGGQVVRIENLYVGTAASTEPAKPSEPIPSCPYPGLAYFGPQEASRFFGREHAIRKLVAALAKRGFTALVGASGSGKSSVVLAGLAPRLDALGGWRSTYFRIGTEPDKNPFAALARALEPLTGERGLSDKLEEVEKLAQKLATGSITLTNYIGQCRAANPGKRVLLIADQFEETFTFVPDEVLRNRFIDGLIEAFPDPELGATPDICLVLTLRADFYNAALHHRPLSDRLQDHVENLGPMTRQELRDAIEKPADAAHVGFEPGLVDTILTDVEKRPGSLPLLQFALREMWGRLKTPVMTHSDYDAIGRVEGALAQRAQSIFMDATKNETDASSVALFRHLFTRLVTLGEGAEDTRRIVGREELGRDAWALAQKLAGEDNRLVVTAATTPGQETAEVAHEALIRNWPALVDWVDRDRAFISWRNQLSQRLDDWRKSPSDEGTLLRGGSLGVAEGWLARRGDDLSEDEMTFVARSVGLRDAEMRQAERIRKDKEAIRRANFQLAVALVGLFFAVVLGLALFELRRHALLKGEIKRLVSTAQAASTETNREPLLLFLSATYEADSDVWAVDKEPILRALIKRLDSSPREVGRYSAVAFDANNARLAWIPSGGLDGDYMYVCSLLRGHNCDMTAENKQQKIVQEYKVPKPIQESANPMLMGSSFIPLMGFIDGLKLPIIIKNGILYYLPAGVSGVEWQNDDPWRMLDLAEIIGQRGDLGWIRFDIEGGVIEVLDQDWKNLKQRMGRIEYLAEKGFVYSDLTLKIEWDTVGSLIPVAAPGGQFGAALVSSLANPPFRSHSAIASKWEARDGQRPGQNSRCRLNCGRQRRAPWSSRKWRKSPCGAIVRALKSAAASASPTAAISWRRYSKSGCASIRPRRSAPRPSRQSTRN